MAAPLRVSRHVCWFFSMNGRTNGSAASSTLLLEPRLGHRPGLGPGPRPRPDTGTLSAEHQHRSGPELGVLRRHRPVEELRRAVAEEGQGAEIACRASGVLPRRRRAARVPSPGPIPAIRPEARLGVATRHGGQQVPKRALADGPDRHVRRPCPGARGGTSPAPLSGAQPRWRTEVGVREAGRATVSPHAPPQGYAAISRTRVGVATQRRDGTDLVGPDSSRAQAAEAPHGGQDRCEDVDQQGAAVGLGFWASPRPLVPDRGPFRGRCPAS